MSPRLLARHFPCGAPLILAGANPSRPVSRALCRFSDGKYIIRQGDIANKFYILKEGTCKVLVDNKEVNEIAGGEFFGEQGFIAGNSKRKASIVANGRVVAYSLSREQFKKIFDEREIRKLFPKRQAISAAVGQQKVFSKPADADTKKTDADRALISKALAKNPLMEQILGEDQILKIVDEMWRIRVPVGKDIIKEGDNGDNFYIVRSGNMAVYKRSDDGKGELRVAERGPGTSFGEIALMYNCARKATVRCDRAAELWAIDRYTFKRISENTSAQMLAEYESFLTKVAGFDRLTKFERCRIAEALEEVKYKPGATIIKEGDVGDSFYILKVGHVVARKVIDGKMKQVMEYKRGGDYFGERAILKDVARAATCTAVALSTCLVLKRDVFELLLGPLRDLMNRTMEAKYGEGGADDAGADADAMAHHTRFSLADFKTVGILGKGSFGSVKLVEAKGKQYALKAVSKQHVSKLKQEEHMMNERNIMLKIHHPFVVVMYQAFQDRDYLYFLLEPALGGELFTVLRDKSYFKQHEAMFYAASVVSVFEYLHSKDIIYRDLKPENLLLDDKGYLKVTDFGFAKVVKDRTWTLCGTPDYLAPEIISSRSHGKGVDWWTLGILTYEMLVSYPPFFCDNAMEVYARIMHAKLKFPKDFNRNAESFIRALLKTKPSSRLGVIAGGAQTVKKHSWFKGFKWNDLLNRTMTAPIVKRVNKKNPLQHFEEYPDFSDTEAFDGDNAPFKDFDS